MYIIYHGSSRKRNGLPPYRSTSQLSFGTHTSARWFVRFRMTMLFQSPWYVCFAAQVHTYSIYSLYTQVEWWKSIGDNQPSTKNSSGLWRWCASDNPPCGWATHNKTNMILLRANFPESCWIRCWKGKNVKIFSQGWSLNNTKKLNQLSPTEFCFKKRASRPVWVVDWGKAQQIAIAVKDFLSSPWDGCLDAHFDSSWLGLHVDVNLHKPMNHIYLFLLSSGI